LLWTDGSSAVLIEGARCVGKNTTAEAFAKTEYDDYILIDFSTAEQAIKDNFDNILYQLKSRQKMWSSNSVDFT